jgi:hypothetical protein
MKKLMAILFVMALVNVANAGIVDLQISSLNGQTINPTNQITLSASDTIGVDVVYTPGQGLDLWSISKEVVMSNPALMTVSIGGTFSKPTAPLTLTWAAGWSNDFSNVSIISNPDIGGVGNALIDAVANDHGTVASGVVIDHFLLHCEGLGNLTVALVENGMTGAGASQESDRTADFNLTPLDSGAGLIIHQVPEPMTLTLLGLGSLFLARKKK